ncbi:STAS domain-containing protein [Nocardia abscessus]|uniref:STAS domain-containing protein n=1 Tax=Nocardia abscessus TaxID=120957 RepID=UPI001895788A|nr:STAS domain-containing protein [Nocardia abscessus]MBF6340931.1 STAS domain-containing protein [Nocardia abscessus]
MSTLRTSRISSGPSGLRCAGAVDFTTRDAWRTVLAELVAVDRDVHLDLSELTFIDVNGTSILVEVASDPPQARRIVLHRPPPMMLRILEVFWPFLHTIEVVHT